MQKTMWYFGTMHVTLRMTIMLHSWCFGERIVETLEPWLLMARLKTRGWKQRLNMYQSSQLQNRDKFLFESATFQSMVNGKDLSISSMPTISFYYFFAYTFVPDSIYHERLCRHKVWGKCNFSLFFIFLFLTS